MSQYANGGSHGISRGPEFRPHRVFPPCIIKYSKIKSAPMLTFLFLDDYLGDNRFSFSDHQ